MNVAIWFVGSSPFSFKRQGDTYDAMYQVKSEFVKEIVKGTHTIHYETEELDMDCFKDFLKEDTSRMIDKILETYLKEG